MKNRKLFTITRVFPENSMAEPGPGRRMLQKTRHDGSSWADNYLGVDQEETDFPISLYRGEKREYVTDLSLNTPAGALTFTRTYRQSKQATYTFMGLGWTHNHHIVLTKTPGTPNTIVVQLGRGAEVHFTETYSGSNIYGGDVGSTASITWNGSKYTMVAQDKSLYLFETGGQISTDVWQITSLVFTSGETLTFTYDGASKKLTDVTDSYGKGLQLSYISHASYFDDGQLARVDAMNNGNATGVYVSFGYIEEMLSGSVDGSGALLSTVQDARGNVWTYRYYGQEADESDANQQDFLVELRSPAVDPSGLNSQSISVKKLTYQMDGATITGITEITGDGAMRTDFAFQPDGENITTQTVAGKTTIHRFAGNLYQGPQDPAGNATRQTRDPQSLRPATHLDANNHETQLSWSADGKFLNQVTDALGNRTGFSYHTDDVTINGVSTPADTLASSIDALGRTTRYTYDDSDNPRLPTRVQVFDTDGETVLSWQEFAYDSAGRTLVEKTLDPASGLVEQQTERVYYTSGNGNGLLQKLIRRDLQNPANDATTLYFYDTLGRVSRTNQNLTFGSCTSSFNLYDAAGNVIASVCNYDNAGGADPTTLAGVLALYNPADPDKNRTTSYAYDALGRRIRTTTDPAAPYTRTNLTVFDSLNRVVRTISNYVASPAIAEPASHAAADFDHGSDNDRNLVSDTAYNERGLVRRQTDILGSVTLYGYDDAGRLVRTIQSAGQPDYDNSYALGGDPELSRYAASDAPDQDLITLNQYDPAGNLVKSTDALGNVTLTGYDALNQPLRVIQSASQPDYDLAADPELARYVPSQEADRDLVSLTEYNTVGQVSRTRDVAGRWTLFGYDGLGRLVKMVASASQPDYDVMSDADLSDYAASDNFDQDIITQTAFDPLGRVMYTADPLDRRSWQAYDGLNRVVRTILNASGMATDGGVKDPRSPGYNPIINQSDTDQISTTTYDTNGYLLWRQDSLGRRTWSAYDSIGRQVRTISNAVGMDTDGRQTDPRSPVYLASPEPDRDLTTQTIYDEQGRVSATLDTLGNQTRFTYDALGRRIRTVANFVTGTFHPHAPDQDLVSTTVYDIAGRVISTEDARGTRTAFSYDRAGRRLTVTQAAGTALATTSYTCYDKGGRVLRAIQNWISVPGQPSPDARGARGAQGNFLFDPDTHGADNDQNLVTTYTLDRLGRQVALTNPAGNTSNMTYTKDGQVVSMTDPLGVVTAYRYDSARRRVLVVQGYQPGSFTDPVAWFWNPLDEEWQDGRGATITFGAGFDQNVIVRSEFDKAGRLLAVRDPNGNRTSHAYDRLNRRIRLTDPLGHVWATRYDNLNAGVTQTLLTDPLGHVTVQITDRAGRPKRIQYLNETPKDTPDVVFAYDKGGNRLEMSEWDGTTLVRGTRFTYDQARRLRAADFDTDGDGDADQTVNYQYDAGGLRTRLTLPGDLDVVYVYDAHGQLVSLTDWDNQATQYGYDGANRLSAIQRSNGMDSAYSYDAAHRLTNISHMNGVTTIASFAYTLNALGNRMGVVETQALTPSGTDTHNIQYAYDGLSRLTQAVYRDGGSLGSGTLQRQYDYAYDLAGNRTQQVVNIGGVTTTDYTYNGANQMTSDGTHTFIHDDAGRLTNDGVNTYTWDRADRLLSMGGSSYLYNGLGQRVQQTVGMDVTDYLVDLQPGLAVVLAETTEADTTHYIHHLWGIHQQQNPDYAWLWMVPDALGTVRSVVNDTPIAQETRLYSPYGEPTISSGSSQTAFGFTGEPYDNNGLLYLRARYYDSIIGRFFQIDPAGIEQNLYQYAMSSPVVFTDPSGLSSRSPSLASSQSTCSNGLVLISRLNRILGKCSVIGASLAPIVFQQDPANPYNITFLDFPDFPWLKIERDIVYQAALATENALKAADLRYAAKAVKLVSNYRYSIYDFCHLCKMTVTGEAWQAVFGNNVILKKDSKDPGYGCDTGGAAHTITCYPKAFDNDYGDFVEQTVIHEFGHLLNYRAGSKPYDAYDQASVYIGTNYIFGYLKGMDDPQTGEHKYSRSSLGYQRGYNSNQELILPSLWEQDHAPREEDFADMFMNWTLNSFASDLNDPINNTAGKLRYSWIEDRINGWIGLSVKGQ